MPSTHFPLRWESTGDQWWYASPIDWAAANGHYDLVRELLRLDNNHLINLTSLRRIRRLETVWDDDKLFLNISKHRSQVAQKLLQECQTNKDKSRNSLIRSGYGGWLLYTAASAGDLGFVKDLLERDPLLVFGEGEYGVTDVLYAAARSKSCQVFRVLFDYAMCPRFGGEEVEQVPSEYKWEMVNRGVHAAARGGNLEILKQILPDSAHVLAYRDIDGSTILHAAAGKGQLEVVKDLVASYDIINASDSHGNTALHVAAYRGQLPVVEALILASPSSIHSRNNSGETFLHMAVAGFQTPNFRRLDRQIDLMKQLVYGKVFNIEEIINVKNNDDRTALHLAIIGNIHSDLVELLMTIGSIDVNILDINGMTPLDLIRQRPQSASSEILTKQLISAGGIFCSHDYSARKTIVSQLRMQSIQSSPGTNFRIADSEIFLYTGIENASDGRMSHNSTEMSQLNLATENPNPSKKMHQRSVNYAAQHLKRLLHWPKIKARKQERTKKLVDENSASNSDGTLMSLRQRYSKPSSLPNNKRTVSVRSNLSSPNAKKKIDRRPSSFSKSLVYLNNSSDKLVGSNIENAIAGPSCSNQIADVGKTSSLGSINKRVMNQFFCMGASGLTVQAPSGSREQHEIYDRSVLSIS